MTLTKKTLLALACTGAVTFAGSAFAAGSTTLAILGAVVGTCQFASGSYLMTFGQLDPSSTTNITRTTDIGYFCTNGTAASSIMIGGNTSSTTTTMGLTSAPGATLPLQLTWNTPTTLGSGFAAGTTPITFTVTGTILASDLNTAVAGQYVTRQPIVLAP